ncbi:MAG TPA: TrbI/VirB10 family protein [Vicinamibacterales bacterium]|nr:TrbI/VirB10 family protein [Vicinamibacterales bacterium]
MFSKPLAFLLLVLGCVTAAAGGAYLATRHNAADLSAARPAAALAATPSGTAQAAAQPVAETEAPVTGSKPDPAANAPAKAETDPAPAPVHRAEPAAPKQDVSVASHTARAQAPPARTVPLPGSGAQTPTEPQAAPQPLPAPASDPIKPLDPQPEPRQPQFEDVILPAGSIIGLQLETPLSSEGARVEDRVEARVTRDVMAEGRVAIPATSRVVGSVTAVEKGGKVKQPARLAIRFHTLILADGSEVALHTDPIDRTGESPANDSAKKIGGAAIGGAILGAILGGGKGAAIGGATGGAAGTAAVMSGDRSVVALRPGSLLNARLSAPATITVERRDQ